jgi:hypothetical protein
MKKIAFLFLFVILLGLVSASEIDLIQEEYYPGETLQAYLFNYSANPLANIYILDNESNQVSVAPLVVEYEDGLYFTYFNLPLSLEDNNYEIVVVNDRANFTVINSTKVISIKPGVFVLEDDGSIKIELENVGSEDVTVELGSDNPEIVLRKTIVEVSVGEEKNVYADYNSVSMDSAITVRYNSKEYSIPLIYEEEVVVNITVNETVEENVTEVNETIIIGDVLEFVSELTEQRIDVERDKVYEASLTVKNNFNEDIDVLVVLGGDLSDILEIENSPDSISANSEFELDLVLNKNKGAMPKEYQGDLQVISDELTLVMPFYVQVIEGVSSIEPVENGSDEFPELPVVDEGMDPVVLIGVVMIAILVVILVILYWKMKQEPKKEYKEVLKERLR